MAKVQIDISSEMTFDDLVEWASSFDVVARVVELIGPAGGNPLVEFEGHGANLAELLHDYGWDDADIEEFQPFIE